MVADADPDAVETCAGPACVAPGEFKSSGRIGESRLTTPGWGWFSFGLVPISSLFIIRYKSREIFEGMDVSLAWIKHDLNT